MDVIFTPELVTPLGVKIKYVAVANLFSCVISAGEKIWCWGSNPSGRCGNSGRKPDTTPSGVVGGIDYEEEVVSVCCGLSNCAALTEGGGKRTVWTWGEGNRGALGRGQAHFQDCLTPVEVRFFLVNNLEIESIAGSSSHFAAVSKFYNRVYVWGANYYGQCGIGRFKMTSVFTPTNVLLPVGLQFVSLACGGDHTLVIMEEKRRENGRKGARHVFSWGRADTGQLGNSKKIYIARKRGGEAIYDKKNIFIPTEIYFPDSDSELLRIGCGRASSYCLRAKFFHLNDKKMQNEKIAVIKGLFMVKANRRTSKK